jgi:hypothetical protein
LAHCQHFCGGNQRLGRYFEALLAFWLSHDPGYELLYHDLQMQVDGRTLGAFDFIVRDRVTDATVHIEVAIKFYLGTGGDEWPGPNRGDSLPRKLAHMQQVQSRLSLNPAVRQQLLDIGVAIDRRMVMLKGRLFYPAMTEQAPPLQACAGHLQGQWWQQDRFFRHFSGSPRYWVVLEKSDWLSTLRGLDHKQGLMTEQLQQCWRERPMQWPRCLAAVAADGNEIFRVFVVPDNWGD